MCQIFLWNQICCRFLQQAVKFCRTQMTFLNCTMLAGESLSDMWHQESFGFSISLAHANHSFMKGQPAHQEGCNLLQWGHSQLQSPGAGKTFFPIRSQLAW
jgi:hypothetical protein